MTLRALGVLLVAGAGWTALAAAPTRAASCDQEFEQVRARLAQSQFSGSERREYQALLEAARAMQQNGDEQVCIEILDRTRGLLQQRATTGGGAAEDPQARAARYAALKEAEPFTQIARFESIRDLGVVNPKGEHLGQIIDLVINFGNHQVQYALLSMSSGFFGDQKIYPVPIDVLKIGDDPGPAPGAAGAGPTATPVAGGGEPDGTVALGMIAQMTVGELVGSEVKNERGDSIGEIDAVILPANAAEIEAVVSVGGLLGIGDKSIALPLERLTMTEDGLRLKAAVTEEELKQLPKVEVSAQERLPDETVIAEVVPAASAPAGAGASMSPGGGAEVPPAAAEPDARPTGSPKPAGQTAAADGAPENPLAQKVLVLDIDRTTLEQAPGFTDGAYPDLADAEWHETVLSFYENVLHLGGGPAKPPQPEGPAKAQQSDPSAKTGQAGAPAKTEEPEAPAKAKQP